MEQVLDGGQACVAMCPAKTEDGGSRLTDLRLSSEDEESSLEEVDDEDEEEQLRYFEGVEKLLEVWFTTKAGGLDDSCDLRKIPRLEIDRLLFCVRCTVVSFSRNAHVDAYVLSESSLFVARRRIVLKTCGNTTPLKCLASLIDLARIYAGFDVVEDIFYSRKNFLRPELQLKPHRSFEQEVRVLDKIFADGTAYCLGAVNRDCWYLYALNPPDCGGLAPGRAKDPDQTIEILMTDLDPEVMHIFSKKAAKDGKEATKLSGIDTLLPGMKIDEHLFDPCGYSMNGILKNDSLDVGSGEYMTIHVTPEPKFSYVSFESNASLSSYAGLIERVVDVFRPAKFLVTIFATRNCASVSGSSSPAGCFHRDLQTKSGFGRWTRDDFQFCAFQDYEITYAHYVKFPS